MHATWFADITSNRTKAYISVKNVALHNVTFFLFEKET